MHNEPLLTAAELTELHAQAVERSNALRIAAGLLHGGPQLSRRRGLGLELFESRPYCTGDDMRHLDWRATARHGKPISKVFRAEQQRNSVIVVDRAPSMAFGTRGQLKAAAAVAAAASLSFAAIADHETVAGITINDVCESFSPRRDLTGIFPFINSINAPLPPQRAGNTPAHPLTQAAAYQLIERSAGAGSHVYLISDFYFFRRQQQTMLAQLAQRYAVTAFHILDPAEEQLSNVGLLRIFSASDGREHVIDTSNAELRRRYAEQQAERLHTIRGDLARCGCEVLRITTQHAIPMQLQHAIA